MGIPTSEELDMALTEATRLHELGVDDHFLGKVLLDLNFRMKFMEDLLAKASLYLHSGGGAHEHAELVRAIERAQEARSSPGDDVEIHPW